MNSRVLIGLIVGLLILGGGGILLLQNRTTPAQNETQITSVPTQGVSPSDMEHTTTPSDVMGSETTPSVTTTKGTVKEFTVNGSNFKFTPATMTVNKGDTVRIVFKNTGGMHDFVIDELNVRTNVIQGGAEETVEFVADKAGAFEYYCSVGNHRQMGMVGTLTVQ